MQWLSLYRRVIAAVLIVVPLLAGWAGISISQDELNAIFGPLGEVVSKLNEVVAAALIVWSKVADARRPKVETPKVVKP